MQLAAVPKKPAEPIKLRGVRSFDEIKAGVDQVLVEIPKDRTLASGVVLPESSESDRSIGIVRVVTECPTERPRESGVWQLAQDSSRCILTKIQTVPLFTLDDGDTKNGIHPTRFTVVDLETVVGWLE